MRIIISIFFLQIVMIPTYSQYKDLTESMLKTQYKVSFINPGIEKEFPLSLKSTVSIHVGVGYSGSYPHLTEGFVDSGIQHLISSFADVQYRRYYNRNKRLRKKKNIRNNSGSFFVLRGLIRGKEISSSFYRTSDIDFAVGVGWGFQKYKNRFGWSFSVAPYYYFDDKGNSGFLPPIPEINLSYVISRK